MIGIVRCFEDFSGPLFDVGDLGVKLQYQGGVFSPKAFFLVRSHIQYIMLGIDPAVGTASGAYSEKSPFDW